jgi:hypothetical protein
MKKVILNSQGQPITLSNREAKIANNLEKSVNALGYQVDITSLTTIMKKVSEQKFFEIAPADYLPVRVGEGAWSTQLTTYRSFSLADSFETGMLNTGANNSSLAVGDAGVDSVDIAVNNWAKQIGWTLFDLEHASKSGNWDLVTAKEKSRKKNWDLGIQKIAFIGMEGNASVKGLLNQAGITSNTALITKAISSMTGTELKAFTAGVLEAYRANCNRTAMPTHFVIPESDYLGLASPSNADFHIKSTLEVLQDTFRVMTGNPSFQIKPCAYAESSISGLGVQRYALYNSEEESLRMDIPVDYTNTLANSIDNFSFQNVGYGQFTGALAYRPQELLYFDF